MLILSRKVNESIVIDGRITVKVVRVEGDQVKLGIQAPRDVPVHRQEVYDEILRAHPETLNQPGRQSPRLATQPTSPNPVPPDLRSSSAPPPVAP